MPWLIQSMDSGLGNRLPAPIHSIIWLQYAVTGHNFTSHEVALKRTAPGPATYVLIGIDVVVLISVRDVVQSSRRETSSTSSVTPLPLTGGESIHNSWIWHMQRSLTYLEDFVHSNGYYRRGLLAGSQGVGQTNAGADLSGAGPRRQSLCVALPVLLPAQCFLPQAQGPKEHQKTPQASCPLSALTASSSLPAEPHLK